MSDIIFNPDESNDLGLRGGSREFSSAGMITKLAMKLTGIQDEKKVNQALVGLVVCLFVISAIILWYSF